MDFILSWNNHEGELVFPVVPTDGISLSGESDNSTFSTVNGELQLIGKKRLRRFEISSFFPMKPYQFARSGSLPDGMAYVRTIEAVRERRIPFRAVLLGNDGEVLFNMPISITAFEWGLDRAGDIAYKLTAVEYRFADLMITELGEQTEPESVEVQSVQAEQASITAADLGSVKKLYTENEAIWMAKSMYCEWGGEYGGAAYAFINSNGEKASAGVKVSVKTMFAALGWCQCNHVDAGYGATLSAVQIPGRFAYRANAPTRTAYGTDLLALAHDVLDRWSAEKAGVQNVGRVLPKGYNWYGGDGIVNRFRDSYARPWHKWGFTLPSPY